MIKTTLVIPDIHQAIGRAEYLLRNMKYDSVVFLGDYFDSFRKVFSAIETAKWLREKLEKNDNYTFLVGNHDVHYLYAGSSYEYSYTGYQSEYALEVNMILSPYLDRFNFIITVGDYVLTHAGITRELMPANPGPNVFSDLNESIKNGVNTGTIDEYLMAGMDRGGRQPHGGITWCDIRSFRPTVGVNQMFGHSQRPEPVTICGENSTNHMIDCDMRVVAYLHEDESGRISVEIMRPWLSGAQQQTQDVRYDYYHKFSDT